MIYIIKVSEDKLLQGKMKLRNEELGVCEFCEKSELFNKKLELKKLAENSNIKIKFEK